MINGRTTPENKQEQTGPSSWTWPIENRGYLDTLCESASRYLKDKRDHVVYDCDTRAVLDLGLSENDLGVTFLPQSQSILSVESDKISIWSQADLANAEKVKKPSVTFPIKLDTRGPVFCFMNVSPDEKKLFLVVIITRFSAPLMVEIDLVKHAITRQGFMQTPKACKDLYRIRDTVFIQGRYLAVQGFIQDEANQQSNSGVHSAGPNTFIWLFDTTDANYQNKTPCIQYDIPCLADFQVFPGGELWVFRLRSFTQQYLQICHLQPQKQLRVLQTIDLQSEVHEDFVIVGGSLYCKHFTHDGRFYVRKYNPLDKQCLGATCLDDLPLLRPNPHQLATLFNTSQGLCLDYQHNEDGVEFFPETAVTAVQNTEVLTHEIMSLLSFFSRGPAKLIADYAASSDVIPFVRQPQPQKILTTLLADIQTKIEELPMFPDTRKDDPRRLLRDDLTNLRTEISENYYKTVAQCVAECKHLSPLRGPRFFAAETLYERLGVLMDRIRKLKLDEFEVIQFRK